MITINKSKILNVFFMLSAIVLIVSSILLVIKYFVGFKGLWIITDMHVYSGILFLVLLFFKKVIFKEK